MHLNVSNKAQYHVLLTIQSAVLLIIPQDLQILRVVMNVLLMQIVLVLIHIVKSLHVVALVNAMMAIRVALRGHQMLKTAIHQKQGAGVAIHPAEDATKILDYVLCATEPHGIQTGGAKKASASQKPAR